MMNVMTIVGARPQFVKAATVSREIAANFADDISEMIVHTGQHYDPDMSGNFFDELNLPKPLSNLGIASSNHGEMTGRMMVAIEEVVIREKPDTVMVYGDTNSTLAAALVAAKLGIPIAHVEAGLRSFVLGMPEEINRVLTDRLSTFLFCPSEEAVKNLDNEGIRDGVFVVGDVMLDIAKLYIDDGRVPEKECLARLGISNNFILSTIHRAENTDNKENLTGIVKGLTKLAEARQVVIPLHPRTRKKLEEFDLIDLLAQQVLITEPQGYSDMLSLEHAADFIVTDSGGVQKEAYFVQTPCITVRPSTEWVETVEAGWNVLCTPNADAILEKANNFQIPSVHRPLYGNGNAANGILNKLLSNS